MSEQHAPSVEAQPRGDWPRRVIYVIGAVFVILLVAFIIALTSQMFELRFDPNGNLAASSGVSLIYLVMMLGAAAVIHARGLTALMIFGMIVMCSALVIWLILILGGPFTWQTSDRLSFSAAMLTLVSITILHTGGFACLKPRTPTLNGLRVAAIVLMWLFMLLVVSMAILEFVFDISAWWPVMYAISILGVCALVATMVTPSLVRQDRKRWERARESVGGRVSLDLHCPKCGEQQRLPVGTGRCAACKGIITIELEEPRCECGYLLYQLTSPICPECGREISEEHRWPRSEVNADADADADHESPPALGAPPAPAAGDE